MTKLVIKKTPYSYRVLSGSLTAYMDLDLDFFDFMWTFEFGVEPLFKQPEDYDDLPIPCFSDLNAHEQIGYPGDWRKLEGLTFDGRSEDILGTGEEGVYLGGNAGVFPDCKENVLIFGARNRRSFEFSWRGTIAYFLDIQPEEPLEFVLETSRLEFKGYELYNCGSVDDAKGFFSRGFDLEEFEIKTSFWEQMKTYRVTFIPLVS